MDKQKFRKTLGKRPSLTSVLVWSVQQALRSVGRHPDFKRQRKTKTRDVSINQERKEKQRIQCN